MNHHIETYIAEIEKLLQSGSAREHAYRPALKKLVEALIPDVQAINDPAYSGGNAPDFLFQKKKVPIAYSECKDVTTDLDSKDVKVQAERYLGAFGKILLTNYLEFRFIHELGETTSSVIGSREGNTIILHTEQFERFSNLLKDFIIPSIRTISSAKQLAEIMADKARLLRDNALAALKENEQSTLHSQYRAFKEVLIRDLSQEDFVDMYAQTLVYGLFVARYFDASLSNFSRHEAHDLLPSSNPLLKKFFGHVAGTDYDPKIAWMVDSLIEAYQSTDLREIMHREFESKQKDPVLHFYETFLYKYDKTQRKSRGVYYTPRPVVSFIVRSVDHILKTTFNLPKGLADTTKIEHSFQTQGTDGRTIDGGKKVRQQVHKVQILDPAVGTGTFLNEIIVEIHKTFAGQEGRWPSYASKELLPRLHGFELMMASYTMAHLKLGVTLRELGFDNQDERLSVWLTNSLEESVHEIPNLFMSEWLTQESNEASKIKSEMPIMVIVGNPPYSAVSSNETEQVNKLVEKYKVEPGGATKLQERKHWLNDDYVKFLALAEEMVAKNGEGVVAMITNNGYLDNPTFRGMRWHLATTFDKIYVLDLHGSAKKKEPAPGGGKDENVFEIQQGVGIIIAAKTGHKRQGELAEVFHADLYGKRASKFEALEKEPSWRRVELAGKMLYYVPKNTAGQDEYEKGIKLNELFAENVSGIVTMGDNFIVGDTKAAIAKRVQKLAHGDYDEQSLNHEFGLGKNYAKWAISNSAAVKFDESKLTRLSYRPFDERWTYFDNKLVWRWRENIMHHFLAGPNLGLLVTKAHKDVKYRHVFMTNKISEAIFLSGTTGSNAMNLPLYLYSEDGSRVSNFEPMIVAQVEKIVGKTTPEDIFDYIYSVLHSPSYREKYGEFLKTDFPRVPYPKDKKQFTALSTLGKELKALHLLESPKVRKFITSYPDSGSDAVGKITRKGDKVYINAEQYFGDVPEVAWNFYIGGYQPAQKWLKDRKGRMLTSEDIVHYQEIIVALVETDKIMREIDKIKI